MVSLTRSRQSRGAFCRPSARVEEKKRKEIGGRQSKSSEVYSSNAPLALPARAVGVREKPRSPHSPRISDDETRRDDQLRVRSADRLRPDLAYVASGLSLRDTKPEMKTCSSNHVSKKYKSIPPRSAVQTKWDRNASRSDDDPGSSQRIQHRQNVISVALIIFAGIVPRELLHTAPAKAGGNGRGGI